MSYFADSARVVDIPTAGSAMPPAVGDSGAIGLEPAKFARSDHTHASSVQAKRVVLTLTSGVGTWVYPVAYASGVLPVVAVTCETPAGATYKYDADVVTGSVTNAQCQIRVIQINQSVTLPTLLASLLGTVVTIFTNAPTSITVHCIVRKPTQDA